MSRVMQSSNAAICAKGPVKIAMMVNYTYHVKRKLLKIIFVTITKKLRVAQLMIFVQNHVLLVANIQFVVNNVMVYVVSADML